jgi:hypothetical protein
MGAFWSGLYEIALDSIEQVPGVVVVSHEELATGGQPAARALFTALGLAWSQAAAAEFEREAGGAQPGQQAALHNFDRRPDAVAGAWRGKLEPGELETIEQVTAPVRSRLDGVRMPLRDLPRAG